MRGIYWSAATGSSLRKKRFFIMKNFATTKEDVRRSEENYENNTSLGFVVAKLSFSIAKRFTIMKKPFALVKERSNIRCHMASPQQKSLRCGK